MIDAANLRVLATVQKTFGKEGELLMKFNPAVSDVAIASISKTEPVFMLIDGISVPFYVESIQSKGTDKCVVRFEDFLSEELAGELVGRTVFTSSTTEGDEEDLLTEAEFWDELLLDPSMLVNYSFTGKRLEGEAKETVKGIVSNAFDYPGNPCIELSFKEGHAPTLLPCHPDFITDINSKKHHIRIKIPAGLL